ncbi:nitroreductase/quinone reductase family protein [Nocardia sp. NPDC051030]|uniref:nitroreductase/quinone reductase family protein n=1 Tax=Nocardia sp. NPDC051030 TaxID=3155162 RepID=UPI0034322EE9
MAGFAGTIVRGLNAGVVALTESSLLGGLMGRGFAVITYTGRRSGKSFSTPVNYRRSGDGILIGVAMPDKKAWWRNFLDEGGAISIRFGGVDRTGHATARRDDRGRVTVKVRLDEPN